MKNRVLGPVWVRGSLIQGNAQRLAFYCSSLPADLTWLQTLWLVGPVALRLLMTYFLDYLLYI